MGLHARSQELLEEVRWSERRKEGAGGTGGPKNLSVRGLKDRSRHFQALPMVLRPYLGA